MLLSPIHPFFNFPSPSPSSCALLQPDSHAPPQEMETHGSHTSFTQHADPPSFGTSGSIQQQCNHLHATQHGSSNCAKELASGFDAYGRQKVSQGEVDASEPQSSQEGSREQWTRGCAAVIVRNKLQAVSKGSSLCAEEG